MGKAEEQGIDDQHVLMAQVRNADAEQLSIQVIKIVEDNNVLTSMPPIYPKEQVTRIIKKALADERERCAVACELHKDGMDYDDPGGDFDANDVYNDACNDIAKTLRNMKD